SFWYKNLLHNPTAFGAKLLISLAGMNEALQSSSGHQFFPKSRVISTGYAAFAFLVPGSLPPTHFRMNVRPSLWKSGRVASVWRCAFHQPKETLGFRAGVSQGGATSKSSGGHALDRATVTSIFLPTFMEALQRIEQ